MKITLIQLDLVLGSRILLSLLRQKRYEAKSLQINIRYIDSLSPQDLDLVYEYVGDSEVVGLSFNSFHVLAAKQLAIFLKNKGVKYIITGGSHATALPEEAITFSDIVIRYESEVTLLKVLESLKNEDILSQINGIIYKKNGTIINNDKAPDIVWDLDMLPFQSIDTGLITYFDLNKKLYTPPKKELFSNNRNTYFLLASRGCPFDCAYCSNSLYRKMDKNFIKVRKRSIHNILNEMEIALANGFESFYITDDNFFSFSLDEIKLFNAEYNKIIKKPFSVVGINPNNFRNESAESKLKLLLDCGLTDIRVGVQSGSDKTLSLFKRGYKSQEITKLLEPIERNRKTIWPAPYHRLNVAVDFICDAVWEDETDKMATISLAQKILKQYTIFFYTLVYLPGTEIYDLALKNGWVEDSIKDIYLRGIAGVNDNIYNRMLFLIGVVKEREVTISEDLINHILQLSKTDQKTAEEIIDSFLSCINGVEKHHKIDLKHAALHPYLSGFNKWTKTVGEAGKKVLFRSYHQPYG